MKSNKFLKFVKELGLVDKDKDLTPEKIDVLFSKIVNQKTYNNENLMNSMRPGTSDKHQRKTIMDFEHFIGVNVEFALNSNNYSSSASRLEY